MTLQQGVLADAIKLKRSAVWGVVALAPFMVLATQWLNMRLQHLSTHTIMDGVHHLLINWVYFFFVLAVGLMGSLFWQHDTHTGQWARFNSMPVATWVLHGSRFVVLCLLNVLLHVWITLAGVLFFALTQPNIPLGDFTVLLRDGLIVVCASLLPLMVVQVLALYVRSTMAAAALYVLMASVCVFTHRQPLAWLFPFNVPFLAFSKASFGLCVYSMLAALVLLVVAPLVLPKR